MSRIRGTCCREWNPGTWPYVSACTLPDGHEGNHVDRRGNECTDPEEDDK
ncbi:hypothetical protein SEA_DAKITI_93 [Gordonia phage Dakiti]|nr:hypothetical protein SEA_DAKITI_93 [Gordonia phage Dakiti]